MSNQQQPQVEQHDDEITQALKDSGQKVTRENYIGLAYGNTKPKPWTHEHEAGLPENLRDHDKVDPNDTEDDDSDDTPPEQDSSD